MVAPSFHELSNFGKVLQIAKYVGVFGVAAGVFWGGMQGLASIFKKVSSLNDNVQLVMDNHLPHIQRSLNSQDQALEGIKSDVRDLSTRFESHTEKLNTTADSLDKLHTSFTQHLENAVRERAPRNKKG